MIFRHPSSAFFINLLLSAIASAFKFFASRIAGIYRFHLRSVGGNGNFLGGASFCVVVFTFFYVADQVFHGGTSFWFMIDCFVSITEKFFFILIFFAPKSKGWKEKSVGKNMKYR